TARLFLMHYPFLQRCLELGESGRGKVSPNPLVGCVIVVGGSVITEGWHEAFGGSHAEPMALRKAGDLARGATLYVNLEPCCKKGKQPPCTDAIIRAGISTVVFGARDPSNRGAKILAKHGIEVIGPIMEPECRRQNRGFFSLLEQGRPWITVKKAMRKDGTIIGKITSEEQNLWAHTHLRAMHDAILVGAGTVIADDPQLNVRYTNNSVPPLSLPREKNRRKEIHGEADNGVGRGGGSGGEGPRRIILDPQNKIPKNAKILSDEDSARTLIIHEKLPIPDLLQKLKEEGISSVLVEGGPTVWKSFEESGCIDEMIILTSSS
ncbi:riboflavin biosynthesis protein RibD, partial [Candidatus Kaiserbacteria bacterium RIFCSPHIGHO2_01_FULL_56_24]